MRLVDITVKLLPILAILTISCAKVPVKDSEYCGDLGELGADCAHTLTEQTRSLDKPAWDQERLGWVCQPSGAFSDQIAIIEKFCNSTKKCTYEEVQAYQRAQQFMDDLKLRTDELASKQDPAKAIQPQP